MFGGAAKDVNGLNYPQTTSGQGEQKKRVMHSWNLKESQCNIVQCLDTRDDVAAEGGRWDKQNIGNCHLGFVAITLRDKRRLLPEPPPVRVMVKNDDCYDMLKLVMLSTFIELSVLLNLFVIKLCCQCVKYFYQTLHICRTCYNWTMLSLIISG